MQFEALAKTFSKKTLPHSEAELVGDVPAEVIDGYRAHALEHIAESLEVRGFRKGKVPQDLALKKVGEVAVLEEA
ncbi:MAG: trigger factor, partial [Patescibacteria group bacterium]|nr:trigger factor [Patescibacteria group bacterium]